MPVFYPSMVVNLQLLLDEGTKKMAPKSADDLAKSPSGTAPSTSGPAVFAQSPDAGTLAQALGIIPRQASVELPGYRQAGTFNLTFAWKDLPLDPRIIRAIGVSIHLGAVAAGDFATGMTSYESTTRSSILRATPDNLILAGTADGISTDWGKSGQTLQIEGRDLRGILLDSVVPAKTLAGLDPTQKIDAVVSQILSGLPMGAGIKVVVNAAEWPGQVVPSPARNPGELTRANLNAQGTKVVAHTKGTAGSVSFWDLITHYCFPVGAIPYFIGSVLAIRPSRGLYDALRQDKQFDPNIKTPFKNGALRNLDPPQVETSESFTFRRLVFGRDIDNLKLERKLGGVKTPVIRCVSTDTSLPSSPGDPGEGKLIWAEWPPETAVGARTTSMGAGGGTPQTEPMIIPVPHVKDKARLLEIAKDLREEICRQEMGGSVQTKNLSSFGGNNQDPDLLYMKPGDPIEIRVNASGLESYPPPIAELNNYSGMSYEEEIRAVAARLGDEGLARAIVGAKRGKQGNMQSVFRTSNVKYDWDVGSGVAIAFDFQNYVEARNDVNATTTAGEAAPLTNTGTGVA